MSDDCVGLCGCDCWHSGRGILGLVCPCSFPQTKPNGPPFPNRAQFPSARLEVEIYGRWALWGESSTSTNNANLYTLDTLPLRCHGKTSTATDTTHRCPVLDPTQSLPNVTWTLNNNSNDDKTHTPTPPEHLSVDLTNEWLTPHTPFGLVDRASPISLTFSSSSGVFALHGVLVLIFSRVCRHSVGVRP